MPTVTIPSVGDVEFPESMDADAIQRESARLYSEATTKTATTAPEPRQGDYTPRVEVPILPDEYQKKEPTTLPGGESAENITAIESQIAFDESQGSIQAAKPLSQWEWFRNTDFAKRMLGPTPEEKAGQLESAKPYPAPAQIPGRVLEALTQEPHVVAPLTKAATATGGDVGLVLGGEKGKVAGEAIAGAAAGAIPFLAFPPSRLVAAAFAADMASQIPELSEQYRDAVKHNDGEAALRLQVQGLATTLFATMAGSHALSTPRGTLPEQVAAVGAPATSEALKQTETINQQPHALSQQPTTEILRDVPQLAGEGARQVSATESAQRIPPSDISPGEPAQASPSGVSEGGDLTRAQEEKRQKGNEVLTPETAALGQPAPAAPKWTTATGENIGGELYAGIPNPITTVKSVIRLAKEAGPALREAGRVIMDTGKEALSNLDIQKLNDRRKAVLNWSAKLQRSFGEADAAKREIESKITDPVRREGITNWIQAGGDVAELQARASATTNPERKAGYEAALNLTPEEIQVANDVKTAFDSLGQRGQTFGVLKNFIENYVPQIWNIKKGPAVGSSRTLKDQFRFAKARTFANFFEGEQAGYEPKTKDIASLLPVYLHEMNSVIAARQLVAEMSKGVAEDGRPLVAASGVARTVDGPEGQAVLVTPKTVKGDTADYKRLENQPALNDWIWAGKDTAGNPVFEKSDLKLHPEAYAQLKAVLGRSFIKEWYGERTTLTAQILKSIVKALDDFNSFSKRTMMGFLAPFHQVQEGTHGVGHRVNPTFNIPKIDLVNDAAQMDAARHGLMLLPDRASANQFMEGFKVAGFMGKLPVIGKVVDWYQHYLFHEYIPGLKFKTYEEALARNRDVFAKRLQSGEVTDADVKALTATQMNAAYGHLNYADMGRNPTIQHLAQFFLLAPDFLEARARFAGQAIKGATGARVGREQLAALATLAIAQAVTMYTAAKMTGGEWDEKRPFEFRKGNRIYTMRSVPEDISSLMKDVNAVFHKGGEIPFIYGRLSPIAGRGAVQFLSGTDWRGKKVTPQQTVGELAKSPIPLTLRGAAGKLPWVGDFLKPNTSLSIPEQLWGSVGLKISRYSAQGEAFNAVDDFMKEQGVEKDAYQNLRSAVRADDAQKAKEIFNKLLETKSEEEIAKAISSYAERPLTGSVKRDKEFLDWLGPKNEKVYEDAKEERKAISEKTLDLLGLNAPKKKRK